MRRTVPEHAKEYQVRLFEPEDRAGYLDLYGTVFGETTDTWFDWKYADNPYTDHVTIAIATTGDSIVGAKSQVGFELSRDGRRFIGLQPADTMVHPDHRRHGVFSQMTEFVKEVYADREPALFFNYPNEATLAGGLKHGWTKVDHVTTRYRVHNPVSLGEVDAGPLNEILDTASRAVARGLLRLRRIAPTATNEITVRRHPIPPVETLADLYRRAVPNRLHVVRNETYLDWRFGNPNWEYTAYIAKQNDVPVAGAVVGRGVQDGLAEASLTELLPLSKGSSGKREDSGVREKRALLERIVEEYRDVDVITAPDQAIPDALYSSFGFLSDTSPPLSWVASPSVLVAFPLDEELDRSDIDTLDDWVLGLSDRDTR